MARHGFALSADGATASRTRARRRFGGARESRENGGQARDFGVADRPIAAGRRTRANQVAITGAQLMGGLQLATASVPPENTKAPGILIPEAFGEVDHGVYEIISNNLSLW